MTIGVDIGGSHIMAATINEKSPDKTQQVYKMEVGCNESRNIILDSWVSVLGIAIDNLKGEKLHGIGIAIPGPFDYYNGIFPNKGEGKFEKLYDVNLREYIKKELQLDSSTSVRFYNDAACFGIGEAWVGELSTFKKCVAITLGTGMGATFLDKGIPLKHGAGVPKDGELYHLPFEEGIADTYFSTQWFQRRYEEISGNQIKGVKELIMDTQNLTIAELIFKEFSQNLAVFLAPWLSGFEAEALVIGGNISNAWHFFEKDLKIALKEFQIDIPVYRSKLLENAALIGSARIIDNEIYDALING
ncbi:ROK family protein [Aquimarina spongiae]|uniref:Glucokinase n=1 Tax=Aquimarina spongiae TaxID=570521 RepID=A0A1M6A6F0_9FLAO|nr:ROK family protein [Aquimarina spongiae]SHI32084.1 glucokinase [Aquimarina spongiae]